MEQLYSSFAPFAPLKSGDKVAVLSPASDAASHFPWVLDQGVQRLRDEFNLEPVEYPTTRMRLPTPEERAEDVNNAFADKSIKAIFTTLGGEDQVKVLPFLDAHVLRENPKPFFGYSDNTNIIQFLWNLKIPAYYGGALMTQFAMQRGMFELTKESLRTALFDKGILEVPKAPQYTDIDLDWADESNLNNARVMKLSEGWFWDGQKDAEGKLWGGCVESLMHYMAADRMLPDFGDESIILFFETAENLPESQGVNAFIDSLAERGVFQNTVAVLVGRPKAWDFSKQLTPAQGRAYSAEQRQTITTAVRRYSPEVPIVQGIDFGHTDPQILVPSGNVCRVDSLSQKIYFEY